jgi:hypothetical protein
MSMLKQIQPLFQMRLRRCWLVATVVFGLLLLPSAVLADEFTPAQSVPTAGMLTSLSSSNQLVAPATTATASSLIGVAATNTSDFSAQPGQVNIATGGVTKTFVSTLNGPIKVGDPITTSALEGVGAKLTDGSGWIVGLAQASLSSSTPGAIQTTVGSPARTVYVATIPVAVKVSYLSVNVQINTSANTDAPQVLQQVANVLVHKHVSITAVVLSFSVFLIGILVAFSITLITIRTTFSGLSRQPLSRARIVRAEWNLLSVAGLVLAVSIVAGLLLLRYV